MEIQSHSPIINSAPENAASTAGLSGHSPAPQNQAAHTAQADVSVDISAAGRLAATSHSSSKASAINSEEQVQDILQALREASVAAPGQFAGSQANVVSQQVRSLLG